MRARDSLKRNAAANGRECPECGAREGIEWNGGKGVDCSYGCHGGNGCGHQWDASDYRPECHGHESLLGPAGISVYCDGSCSRT